MQTTDIKRGGVRPGAGRKCLAPDQKKVSITISVTRTTAKMLRELRNSDIPVNEMIGAYIEQTFHECKPFGTFGIPK